MGPRADMNHPISPPPPPHPLLARSPAHPAHYRQPRSPPHLGRPVSRASAHLGRTRPSTSRGGPAPKHQHQHQHHWKPNLATYLTPPQAPTAPCSRGEPPPNTAQPAGPSSPTPGAPRLIVPVHHARTLPPRQLSNFPTSRKANKSTSRKAEKLAHTTNHQHHWRPPNATKPPTHLHPFLRAHLTPG